MASASNDALSLSAPPHSLTLSLSLHTHTHTHSHLALSQLLFYSLSSTPVHVFFPPLTVLCLSRVPPPPLPVPLSFLSTRCCPASLHATNSITHRFTGGHREGCSRDNEGKDGSSGEERRPGLEQGERGPHTYRHKPERIGLRWKLNTNLKEGGFFIFHLFIYLFWGGGGDACLVHAMVRNFGKCGI